MMKRRIKGLLAAGIAAAMGAAAAAGYTARLIDEVYDAKAKLPETEADAHVSAFSLKAQMTQSQMDVRIGGWLSTVERENITLADGGLRAQTYSELSGEADAPWAILVHGGPGETPEQVLDVACALSIAGYRVLLPERYRDGETISAGGIGGGEIVLRWIDDIAKWEPQTPIVLFGQDEGGYAVLDAVCSGVPAQVKAAATDGAYASAGERMREILLRRKPDAGRLTRLLADLAMGVMYAETQGPLTERLGENRLPLLLIHAGGDQEIFAWESEELAAAAKESAELLLIEGAGHGAARFVEPERYYRELLNFYAKAIEAE